MLEVKKMIDSYRHLDVKKNHMIKVCMRDHPLPKFKVPEGGDYGCDKCDGPVSSGGIMYGCRICDFDLCETCVVRKLNYNIELVNYHPKSRNELYYLIAILLDMPREKCDEMIKEKPCMIKQNIEEEDALEIATILMEIDEGVKIRVFKRED